MAGALRLLPVLLLPGLVAPVTATGQEPAGVDRLAWLQGCWEATSATGTVEEHWTAPRGGSMVGLSRTVREDRLAAYELIVILEDGDRLAYRAHPSGQASATFLSRAIASDSVVFENPEHDYPQRIGYRLEGDRLTAWIEGTRDGRLRRSPFPYRRAPCPDTSPVSTNLSVPAPGGSAAPASDRVRRIRAAVTGGRERP